jgi:hypothetical protein
MVNQRTQGENKMGARYTRDKLQQAAKDNTGGGTGAGFNWVDLKVDKNTPTKQVTVRLIGFPFGYREHTGYVQKLNPSTKKNEWVETGFHDDDMYEKKKFSRICTENHPNHGACPWCGAGYRVTQKFAQNVLLRTPYKDENGKVQFSSEVAILQKGKMLFVDGILKKEEENELQNENSGLDADDPDAACTFLGGEVAHNIIIKAEFNPKQPNNPDYTISVVNKKDIITQDDIDMLAAVGKPTSEELAQIFSDDPDLREYPEWFNYGYQFQKIYKPTPIKTAQSNTSTADLTIGDEDQTTVKAKSRPAPAKQAAQPQVDEDEFADLSIGLDEADLDLLA